MPVLGLQDMGYVTSEIKSISVQVDIQSYVIIIKSGNTV